MPLKTCKPLAIASDKQDGASFKQDMFGSRFHLFLRLAVNTNSHSCSTAERFMRNIARGESRTLELDNWGQPGAPPLPNHVSLGMRPFLSVSQ